MTYPVDLPEKRLVRVDYALLERIEAELDHRVLTGYYPRLTLASGQRFASKGGYVVRFAGPDGPKLEPVSDWITP